MQARDRVTSSMTVQDRNEQPVATFVVMDAILVMDRMTGLVYLLSLFHDDCFWLTFVRFFLFRVVACVVRMVL